MAALLKSCSNGLSVLQRTCALGTHMCIEREKIDAYTYYANILYPILAPQKIYYGWMFHQGTELKKIWIQNVG